MFFEALARRFWQGREKESRQIGFGKICPKSALGKYGSAALWKYNFAGGVFPLGGGLFVWGNGEAPPLGKGAGEEYLQTQKMGS